MADNQQSVSLSKDRWSLIAGPVDSLTFQAINNDIHVYFTASAAPPHPSVHNGLLYQEGQGELKALLTNLSFVEGASYVWGRAAKFPVATVFVDRG